MKGITKLTDSDGDWYWIPNELVAEYNTDLLKIEGKDYMDDPDKFDEFTDKYDQYRTGGDEDLMPDFFKDKL